MFQPDGSGWARSLPAFARSAVVSAMATQAAVLTVTSQGYGFHRDELYFRMLRPGWGYVDESPLAPLLARGLSRLLADHPWAVRIPATLAAVTSVLVVALVTRELGGGASRRRCVHGGTRSLPSR